MSIRKSKNFVYPYPFDQNGIASLLFLEENHLIQKRDENILNKLLDSYSVK